MLLITFKDLTHSQLPQVAFTLHCLQAGLQRVRAKIRKARRFQTAELIPPHIEGGECVWPPEKNHKSPRAEEQVFLGRGGGGGMTSELLRTHGQSER